MKLNKRFFTIIVSILMILIIPIVIYGFNFNSTIFDEDYYEKEFSKYNVYTNLENYGVEEINNNVLNYFKNEKNNDLIDNDFFNEREKTHLLDVKNLIQTFLTLYHYSIILFLLLCSIFIFLMNFNFRIIVKKLLIILAIGSSLTLLDAVLFFILSNFNFEFVFDVFHKTLFSAGTYMFNPEFENIVILYPQGLFFDFLIKIILNAIISSIILLLLLLAITFTFFKKNFHKFSIKNLD